ncbi:MAG: HAD family hydrolase [Candidatus Zixiibacteriota bacterium]
MDKLRPRAVIFDLGSTLIEYETIPWSEINLYCSAGARKFLHKKGYNVPDETEFHLAYEAIKDKYRDKAAETLVEWTVTQAFKELLARWAIEIDDGLMNRFFDAYYEPLGRRIYPYDDVLETLDKIKRQYHTIGLVSNTVFPERVHRKELKRFGIEPYLDFAVFSSSFGLRKPHPDIFYKAANLAGVAPSECVFVGDRYLEDAEGPNRIGMPAILKLIDGREYPHDMPQTLRTITRLSELDKHLDLNSNDV